MHQLQQAGGRLGRLRIAAGHGAQRPRVRERAINTLMKWNLAVDDPCSSGGPGKARSCASLARLFL